MFYTLLIIKIKHTHWKQSYNACRSQLNFKVTVVSLRALLDSEGKKLQLPSINKNNPSWFLIPETLYEQQETTILNFYKLIFSNKNKYSNV